MKTNLKLLFVCKRKDWIADIFTSSKLHKVTLIPRRKTGDSIDYITRNERISLDMIVRISVKE